MRTLHPCSMMQKNPRAAGCDYTVLMLDKSHVANRRLSFPLQLSRPSARPIAILGFVSHRGTLMQQFALVFVEFKRLTSSRILMC
jgi:hypothetical protein